MRKPKMTQEIGPTIRTRNFLIAGAFVLSTPVLVCAQTADELSRCNSIDDGAARLACYDKLGGRQALPRVEPESSPEPAAEQPTPAVPAAERPTPAVPAAEQPTPAVPAEEEYAPLTDEIGAERLGKKGSGAEDDMRVRGTVTACRKDSLNKYFFYFENGQVWKQKDSERLRYKECKFSVMITKDFFGYKMQVDGEKRRIRIGRVK